MGFLGLIPAKKLAAAYNTVTKTLYLYAEGETQNYTSGIHFARNTILGGFKFSIMGWVGPIGKGTTPYKYSQEFQLNLEGQSGYPKELIIADSTHPQGQAVPIRYLGFGEDAGFNKADVVSGASTVTGVTGTGGNHRQLTVLLKEPFNITQLASVPAGGSIAINFDSNFLTMQTAGIQSPVNAESSGHEDIVWNFNSLKTGNTQVTVTIHGGIAQYVMQITYDVRIIVL
jgi:hypothetical protein